VEIDYRRINLTEDRGFVPIFFTIMMDAGEGILFVPLSLDKACESFFLRGGLFLSFPATMIPPSASPFMAISLFLEQERRDH